ncbi:MAG: hypothetical protein QOD02_4395, partial [Mycobacterium sp.]|nr:hypothetical protein [Mycobacterium sp.]
MAAIHGVLKDAIQLPPSPNGGEKYCGCVIEPDILKLSPPLVIIGVAAGQREMVVDFQKRKVRKSQMSQKSVVLGLESLKQFRVVEETPGYWRATFQNPPVNLYDPQTFLELRKLWAKIEETTDVKVLVFDSADPDYFIS